MHIQRKKSEDSLERLSRILSDKTPESKFKRNVTAQDLLAASTMKMSWLSQTDRELNYAEMISAKIRTRRLCLKVFRALREAIK